MDGFTHDGLRFVVDDLGPEDREPVILLHGFPADRSCWAAVAARLAARGYRSLAPDQRGYSPGARPPERRAYRLDRLAGDVASLADAAGAGRFHLVGHDWGAVVAWYLAAHQPERVATVTAVSVPHPQAMREAMLAGSQALRSWYMLAFQVPGIERLMGARGGAWMRAGLVRSGLGPGAAGRYAARAADPAALRAELAWYRALAAGRPRPVGAVRVPAQLVWGSRDRFVSRRAAEGGSRWAEGEYRLVEVDGSHWLPEEQPDDVAEPVLELLAAHPIGGA